MKTIYKINKMKIQILFIFTLISFSHQLVVELECYDNCDKLGIAYSNPNKEIVIHAACSGRSCPRMEVSWALVPNNLNKKKSFTDDDVNSLTERTLIIAPKVFPEGERHIVILTAKTQRETSKLAIRLVMQKCNKVTPCKDLPPLVSLDYVGDTSFEDFLAGLPAEAIKHMAKRNSEMLLNEEVKSANFITRRKELLSILKFYPLDNEEDIKACSKFLNDMIESTISSRIFRPAAAKLVAEVAKKLIQGRLDLLKKSPNPLEMKKDVQEMSNDVLSKSKVTINEDEKQLTNHRIEEEKKVKEKIVLEAHFIEDYPIYDDFDVVYRGKQTMLESIAEETVAIIETVAEANILTLKDPMEETITDDICMLYILDKPPRLKDTYTICNVSFHITTALAKELLNTINDHTLSASFSVLKKNIYWWKSPNITAFPVNVQFADFNTTKKINKLDNPLKFCLNIKHNQTKMVEVSFTRQGEIIGDTDISFFQIIPNRTIETLLIQFDGMKDGDEFKVVVLKNRLPELKDFGNPIIIPKKDLTGNKYYDHIHEINIPKGSFGYLGIIPTKETKKAAGNRAFNFAVSFTRLSCEVWSDYYVDWLSEYCTVTTSESTSERICCSCKHASVLAGTASNVDSKALTDFWDIPLLLTEEYNFVVLIALILVLFIFILLSLVALLLQRRYALPKKVMVLLDNYLNNDFEYLVIVYTGTQKLAGTTANIGIRLYGTKADSQYHILRGNIEPVLQAGNEDCFYLKTEKDLGQLRKIYIWSDCTGVRASWFCKKIIVQNVEDTNTKWIFEINQWFSVLNKIVAKHFKPVPTEKHDRWTCCYFCRHGVGKNHLWVSPFTRLGNSQFTYLERLSVMLAIVLLAMLLAMICLGLPYPGIAGQFGRGHFEYNFADYGWSMVSAVSCSGVSWLLIYLYEKTYTISTAEDEGKSSINRKSTMKLRYEEEPNDEDEIEENLDEIEEDEVEDDMTFYSSKLAEKEENFKRSCYIVARLASFLIIIVSIGMLAYFGMWFNFNSSLIWLVEFSVAVLFCIVIEVFRVSITAWCSRKRHQKTLAPNLDFSDITAQQKRIMKRFGEKGVRLYINKLYSPMSDIERRLKKEKEKQRIELRTLMFDIITFVIHMIILFHVVLMNKDDISRYLTQNIENIFVHDKFIRQVEFNAINCESKLYDYIRDVYIPALHSDTWYANYNTSESGLLPDFVTRMISTSRIRQQRVKSKTCGIHPDMVVPSDGIPCHAALSYYTQDYENYDVRWKPVKNVNESAIISPSNNMWRYQSGYESGTSSSVGELGIYSSGGYITNFARSRKNSLLVLEYIQNNKWIDERTRVIFLDTYFYNVNQNLFCHLTLIIELDGTGKYITNYHVDTSKLLFLIHELALRVIISFILFVIMLIIFTWRKYVDFRSEKPLRFFKNIWNIIDLTILLFSFAFILAHFIRSLIIENLVRNMQRSARNEFITFNPAHFWDNAVLIVATALVSVSTIRMWRLLRFMRMFKICELTLALSSKYLLAVLATSMCAIFAYSALGRIIFGPYAEKFRTTATSYESLLLHTLGFTELFNYRGSDKAYWWVGPTYYVVLIILLIFMMNIFIAIILVSYETARNYFDDSEKERLVFYNILHFLKDEFKYYTSKEKGRKFDYHLSAGEEKIEIENIKNVEQTKDGHRTEVRINYGRLTSIHYISEDVANILLNRTKKHKNIKLSDYDDLISEVASGILSKEEEENRDKTNDDKYVMIPEEDSYLYISVARLQDIYVIVDYLLRDKQAKTSMGKQVAMMTTMNAIVLRMITLLETMTSEMFKDKSTQVTYKNLGLIVVEDDEEDNRSEQNNQ